MREKGRDSTANQIAASTEPPWGGTTSHDSIVKLSREKKNKNSLMALGCYRSNQSSEQTVRWVHLFSQWPESNKSPKRALLPTSTSDIDCFCESKEEASSMRSLEGPLPPWDDFQKQIGGRELLVLPLWLPKGWDYKHESTHPAPSTFLKTSITSWAWSRTDVFIVWCMVVLRSLYSSEM